MAKIRKVSVTSVFMERSFDDIAQPSAFAGRRFQSQPLVVARIPEFDIQVVGSQPVTVGRYACIADHDRLFAQVFDVDFQVFTGL